MAQDVTRREQTAPESYREEVAVVAPPVDVLESEEEFLVRADMPGVSEDGVNIHLEKSELALHGRRELGENQKEVLTRDFREADYYRSFVIPATIDANQISAELRAGVLWLRLPKSEKAKPRKIEIKTG